MKLNLVTGLGIILAVTGIGVLFNSKRFAKIYTEINSGVCLLYLSGVSTLVFGLVIIALNIPVDFKTWIVEVIGWLGILKGVVLLVIPSQVLKLTEIMPKRGMTLFAGISCLLFGLILLL
jgi:hypothetical protein